MDIDQPVRATALVRKENSILMIHRFKPGEEYFVLPGGGVEIGETSEIAVVRELKEETSLISKAREKIFEFIDVRGRSHQLFLCNYVAGDIKISVDSPEASHTTKDNIFIPEWVQIKNLPDITIWPSGTKDFLINYFKK